MTCPISNSYSLCFQLTPMEVVWSAPTMRTRCTTTTTTPTTITTTNTTSTIAWPGPGSSFCRTCSRRASRCRRTSRAQVTTTTTAVVCTAPAPPTRPLTRPPTPDIGRPTLPLSQTLPVSELSVVLPCLSFPFSFALLASVLFFFSSIVISFTLLVSSLSVIMYGQTPFPSLAHSLAHSPGS